MASAASTASAGGPSAARPLFDRDFEQEYEAARLDAAEDPIMTTQAILCFKYPPDTIKGNTDKPFEYFLLSDFRVMPDWWDTKWPTGNPGKLHFADRIKKGTFVLINGYTWKDVCVFARIQKGKPGNDALEERDSLVQLYDYLKKKKDEGGRGIDPETAYKNMVRWYFERMETLYRLTCLKPDIAQQAGLSGVWLSDKGKTVRLIQMQNKHPDLSEQHHTDAEQTPRRPPVNTDPASPSNKSDPNDDPLDIPQTEAQNLLGNTPEEQAQIAAGVQMIGSGSGQTAGSPSDSPPRKRPPASKNPPKGGKKSKTDEKGASSSQGGGGGQGSDPPAGGSSAGAGGSGAGGSGGPGGSGGGGGGKKGRSSSREKDKDKGASSEEENWDLSDVEASSDTDVDEATTSAQTREKDREKARSGKSSASAASAASTASSGADEARSKGSRKDKRKEKRSRPGASILGEALGKKEDVLLQFNDPDAKLLARVMYRIEDNLLVRNKDLEHRIRDTDKTLEKILKRLTEQDTKLTGIAIQQGAPAIEDLDKAKDKTRLRWDNYHDMEEVLSTKEGRDAVVQYMQGKDISEGKAVSSFCKHLFKQDFYMHIRNNNKHKTKECQEGCWLLGKPAYEISPRLEDVFIKVLKLKKPDMTARMESELRKHWGKNIENHSRKVGTPHLKETILAWAKKIKAEDDDRFKYTYLALGLLLFDHLKRQFVIESDFPLDDQGRPSKTKTIKAWWDEWMPVVCRQWVANNKHDGKSFIHPMVPVTDLPKKKFIFWSVDEVKEEKKIYRAVPPVNSEFTRDAKEIMTEVRDEMQAWLDEGNE